MAPAEACAGFSRIIVLLRLLRRVVSRRVDVPSRRFIEPPVKDCDQITLLAGDRSIPIGVLARGWTSGGLLGLRSRAESYQGGSSRSPFRLANAPSTDYEMPPRKHDVPNVTCWPGAQPGTRR